MRFSTSRAFGGRRFRRRRHFRTSVFSSDGRTGRRAHPEPGEPPRGGLPRRISKCCSASEAPRIRAYEVAQQFAQKHGPKVRLVLQEGEPGHNPKVNQLITAHPRGALRRHCGHRLQRPHSPQLPAGSGCGPGTTSGGSGDAHDCRHWGEAAGRNPGQLDPRLVRRSGRRRSGVHLALSRSSASPLAGQESVLQSLVAATGERMSWLKISAWAFWCEARPSDRSSVQRRWTTCRSTRP